MEEKNKIKRVGRSFTDAWRGWRVALGSEINIKIELAAALIVIILMIVFKITGAEAMILFLVVMIVLWAEIINTAIERIMDVIEPQESPAVKDIKDLMAASVLVVSLASLIIGLIVFIPYIYSYV